MTFIGIKLEGNYYYLLNSLQRMGNFFKMDDNIAISVHLLAQNCMLMTEFTPTYFLYKTKPL